MLDWLLDLFRSGSHAHDMQRATPEISGDGFACAVILAVGLLLIGGSMRTKTREEDHD